MNLYADLADGIALFHFLWVATVAFGQILILIGGVLSWQWVRNPWFRGSHLTMAVIVAFEAAIAYECPLTTWEYDLRILGGQMPANFRIDPDQEKKDLSFVGRNLQAMVPGTDMADITHYIFMGFGALVLGSLLVIPPRHVVMIVSFNVCCVAIMFPCWLYAGQPYFWGQGEWNHGVLVCLWNVLPFVVAAVVAVQWRHSLVRSLILCGALMGPSVIGLYLLWRVRQAAGADSVNSIEWLLPIAQLLGLLCVMGAMRYVARTQGDSAPAAADGVVSGP